MRRWRWVMILMASMLGGVVAAYADYNDGQRAWEAGRHTEALREWQAAANAGDAKAMLALGRLYRQGLGTPQDYRQAHLWFNLAASRFEAEAVKERDALAEKMSPEQVAEAQKQAAVWQPGATPPAASATSKPAGPPPPKAIRVAQELLAALGYELDPPDGHWGERTAQAYQAFVRAANLPVTDTLTPAALQAMRAMARQAGAVSAPKPALPPDALHRAAKAGNLKGLEAALAAGAEVNARDDKGWTALMYVVDKGDVRLVETLMQAKADLDVRAPDGATALFMAADHGHSEIIPKLMQAGADLTIMGPKGKTATEVAQARYGNPEAARAKGEPPAIVALLAGQTWETFSFARARSQAAVEDAAFARAQSLGTVEAYREYLESYPSGRHIEKARQRQAERERPPVSLTGTSPAGTMGRECADCPEMVVVPAGRYRMGDLSGDGLKDERPVHEVTMAYPFAVGKYEVTFAEWDACVAAGGCTHRPDDKGRGRGTRPVISVSWHDAQEYVAWLSRKTGKPYRLLSEAEWEYVARAGTTTKYWWGNEADHHDANYGTDECCNGLAVGKDRWVTTAPVGSFEPNAFGVFDTAGNVWELVEDCWNESYTGAPVDGGARTSVNCKERVVRGGAWYGDPWRLRSAVRLEVETGDRFASTGFRIARTLELAQPLREHPPGSVFRDCVDLCPEMVVVPAGWFRMGDLAGDGDSAERPVHEVTIAHPFAVGTYEVTYAEWYPCVAARGCPYRPDDEPRGRESRPVIHVSWEDAQEYVAWLSRETGKPYRLLSEAEWEYVARAGTTTKYWWGNEADRNYANYGKDERDINYETDAIDDRHAAGKDRWMEKAPVGSFEPNAFGLFDTAGNVMEWVADCWNESYAGAPADGRAWMSGNCKWRVLRGGGWDSNQRNLRSANRRQSMSGHGDGWVGFRVARTLD